MTGCGTRGLVGLRPPVSGCLVRAVVIRLPVVGHKQPLDILSSGHLRVRWSKPLALLSPAYQRARTGESIFPAFTATAVGHITGGTGKLAGIQGTARTFANFDPITGTLGENEANIEYTMGK